MKLRVLLYLIAETSPSPPPNTLLYSKATIKSQRQVSDTYKDLKSPSFKVAHQRSIGKS